MLRRSALAALVVSVVAVAGAVPSAHAAPLRYVALGDSYSAASGVLPLDPAAPLNCLRSSLNYPHVIAGRIGAQLTDVTCGAAETKDFTAAQYANVPPQLDAVRADTELVTMTIGGNDSGVFINAIVQCGAAGALALFQGSPCRDTYGSKFEDTIRTVTYPALVRALSAVRAKAPNARIGIIGYPWITPRAGGCIDKLPLAPGDIPYTRSLQTTLNDAVARAAQATGITYVDMNVVSEGHDACQAIGTRWIEPVLQTTNPVVVHPNALGEAAMAEQAIRVLDPLGTMVAPAAPVARLRLSGLRRRGGRYSVRVSATGAKVSGARISLQRSRGGTFKTVGRATIEARLGPKGARVTLPARTRARSRYRIVVRGPKGSTAPRRTLSFRAR